MLPRTSTYFQGDELKSSTLNQIIKNGYMSNVNGGWWLIIFRFYSCIFLCHYADAYWHQLTLITHISSFIRVDLSTNTNNLCLTPLCSSHTMKPSGTMYMFFVDLKMFNLIHWGRVTHIYVSKLTKIGSDNGLSPRRRQAIIWTNTGILLIGPIGRNFNENLIGIQTFSFKKMHLKMSSAKWRSLCLGLNVLTVHKIMHVKIVSPTGKQHLNNYG